MHSYICFADPFSKCWSRSQKSKYYFDTKRNQNYPRTDGQKFVASFWDNIAESPIHLNWNLSHHSRTTSMDIIEAPYAEDTITVSALMNHIQQHYDNFLSTYGLSA